VTALIRAELLKIRTTRGWWAFLAVVVLLTGIATAGQVGSAANEERSTLEFQVDLADTIGITVLLAIILGIMVITTEFRHGTTTPTFLAAPRRERVIAAKVVATTLTAIGFGILALLVVSAVALPWLSILDATTHIGDGEVLTQVLQAFLAIVQWALIGVAIGTLVQSQVAALVGTLIWIFVVETLLVVLFEWLPLDGIVPYLPFRALDAADGTGSPELLSYGAAIAVSFVWIVLLGAAGVVRTLRRDIT
jgi:ABC-type transport system involved in multi-copper enzyme maturation permease subunit